MAKDAECLIEGGTHWLEGFTVILGECRTLWGERERAMHCSVQLLREVSAHSTEAVHGHIAKTRSVTVLSTKMLNIA